MNNEIDVLKTSLPELVKKSLLPVKFVIKTNNGLKFVDGLAIDVWTSRRFYLRGERTI